MNFAQPYFAPLQSASSSGPNPDCSMRSSVPVFVAATIHVTALSTPSVPQRYASFTSLFDHQHFRNPITPLQFATGVARKSNLVAHHRLEIVVHQPFFNQRALRQRPPHFLWRARASFFDYQRAQARP